MKSEVIHFCCESLALCLANRHNSGLLCRNLLFELNYMVQREKTIASCTPQWGITVFCEQLRAAME